MFLYVEDHNMNRKQYKILEYEDLQPIFTLFPRTERIALNSSDLKEAVTRIAKYISSGHLKAWAELNPLEKGLKERAAALGLSLATTIAPNISSINNPEFKINLPDIKIQQKTPETDFGSHPTDRFLWNTMQIESSGGTNLEHKPVRHGKYKGEVAIGKWGLLKPTVNEIVNRMRIKGKLTPEFEKLEGMSRDEADQYFKKNPQAELTIARHLASHVLKRQKGDHHKAAYAWLYGHNLFPTDISPDHLQGESYVEKYKKYDKNNPFKQNHSTRALASVNKSENPSDTSFSVKFKNWYQQRTNQKTKQPMRSSNYTPDLGRRRDSKLDEIKADSQKTSEEKLKDNLKQVNKK